MLASSCESKARVRTRTGCFECRKRRKKCDERRPKCRRCTSNGAACSWPTTTTQPIDRRRREGRQLNPQSPGPRDDHQSLYAHFTAAVLPQLVRPNCPSEYLDQSHMLRLSLIFPPLMAIMIAIAAVDTGQDALAMDRYLYSLRTLQDRIAVAADAGNEDAFLATTVCLCVFENLRSDAPPSIGLHARAAGVLLSRRNPEPTAQSPSQSTVVFERICAESFLYHSTLMMLFDPSLDMVIGNIPRYVTRAITDSPGQAVPPFILEESYQFFLMIAEVTRLARLSRPLYSVELQTWTRLQASLLQYKRNCDTDDPIKSLYVRAIRILLLKADSMRTIAQRTAEMKALFYEGLPILCTLDAQKYLLSYSLWPVAVLGAIAVGEDEQRVIDSKIVPWARMRRGQAMRLRNQLRAIWASPEGSQETILLERLQLLTETR